MNKIKLAVASLAAAVLGASAAQAMPVAKGSIGFASAHAGVFHVRHGGPHFYGGGVRSHHFHGGHHFRHHGFWGPRVYLYGGGGGGCYWLKEQALETGSRYWWRRYHVCRNGW